jgi:hypothetical protein
MAGKAGRSGRKPGSKTSWHKNVTALCGNRLNILIVWWLKKAILFLPEPRHTVPPKPKAALAQQAILEVLDMIELEDHEVLTIDEVVRLILDDDPELRRTPGVVAVDVDAVLAWSRRQAPKGPSLRRRVRGPDPDPYAQYVERLSNVWADKAAAQMDGAASVAAMGAYATPVHK